MVLGGFKQNEGARVAGRRAVLDGEVDAAVYDLDYGSFADTVFAHLLVRCEVDDDHACFGC